MDLLLYQSRKSEIDIKIDTPDDHIPIVFVVCIVRQVILVCPIEAFDIPKINIVGCNTVEVGREVYVQIRP